MNALRMDAQLTQMKQIFGVGVLYQSRQEDATRGAFGYVDVAANPRSVVITVVVHMILIPILPVLSALQFRKCSETSSSCVMSECKTSFLPPMC